MSASRMIDCSRFLLPLLLACTGCTAATGNIFSSSSQHRALSEEAKTARQATAAQGLLPLPRELNKSVIPAFVVQPGDGLLIQPTDLDAQLNLMPDQTVLADGTIHLGKYGQVVVAGKTVPHIEALVKSTIDAYYKKDMGAISVRVVVADSLVYYVLGEVNNPGSFRLKGRETALDGILAAGGLNGRASEKSIIISRPTHPHGCRVVLPVCYRPIVQLGDTTTNYQLQPGDRIFVGTRTFLDLFHGCHKNICAAAQIPCGAIPPCAEPAQPPVGNPLPSEHVLPLPDNALPGRAP